MTTPALHLKSLLLRARRALPGRKVSPLKEGVAKTWTDRPPTPMPSAFTPSNPVGRFWTSLSSPFEWRAKYRADPLFAGKTLVRGWLRRGLGLARALDLLEQGLERHVAAGDHEHAE